MVLSDLLECGSSSRSSCKKCLYSHFQKFNFCSRARATLMCGKLKLGTVSRSIKGSLEYRCMKQQQASLNALNGRQGMHRRRTLFTTSLVYHHCFLLKKKQKAEHQKLMAVKVVLAQRPSLFLSSFTFTIFSQIVCKVRHTVHNLHFLSKNSTLISRFFLGEKLVKMLWFWTF